MTQKSYRKERRPFDKLRDLGELRSGSRLPSALLRG